MKQSFLARTRAGKTAPSSPPRLGGELRWGGVVMADTSVAIDSLAPKTTTACRTKPEDPSSCMFLNNLQKEGDAKCSIPRDGGWNAKSCAGGFPGFRRLRRRTATSASSDTCAVRGLAGSTKWCLRFLHGSTPRPSLPFTSIRILAITGGRTQLTAIRVGGSVTTGRDIARGIRLAAPLPTASGSPSITLRTRAHDKNTFLFRGKSRI